MDVLEVHFIQEKKRTVLVIAAFVYSFVYKAFFPSLSLVVLFFFKKNFPYLIAIVIINVIQIIFLSDNSHSSNISIVCKFL